MPHALIGVLALPALFVVFGLAWWGRSHHTCHDCPDPQADGDCEGCPLKGAARRRPAK